MLRLLMGVPSRSIDVKLEDEERCRRGRRAVGQEQLHAGLGHRRLDQVGYSTGDRVGFTGFCFDMDSDHEPLVEIAPAKCALVHLRASLLGTANLDRGALIPADASISAELSHSKIPE